MRVCAIGSVLAVLLVGAYAAPALGHAAAPRATGFRTTLTPTITAVTTSCCVVSGEFQGNWGDFEGSAVIPRLGRATYTGLWVVGCVGVGGGAAWCSQDFVIRMTGTNGRQIEISSDLTWPYGDPIPARTWGAWQDFSGTGTYSWTLFAQGCCPQVGDNFTIALDGSLSRTPAWRTESVSDGEHSG